MKNFKILSWLFAILLLFSHMHTNAVVINNPDGTKVWFNGCPPGETCPLSKADSIYLGIFQAITAVIQNTACGGSGVRNVDSIYQHFDTIFYAINGTTYYLPQSNNLFSDTAEIKYYTVLSSNNTPIVSPVSGATYLVGNSPTGVWASHAKDVAEWNGSSWTYYDGVQGDYLYNTDNALTYQYRSSNWVQTTGIPILNNGNTISTGVRLGTNNLKSLTFETNNVARGRIDSSGNWYMYSLPTASTGDTSLAMINSFGKLTKIGKQAFLTGISGGTPLIDAINNADSLAISNLTGEEIFPIVKPGGVNPDTLGTIKLGDFVSVIISSLPLPPTDTTGDVYRQIANYTFSELNSASADTAIYLPISLSEYYSSHYLVAIHYNIFGVISTSSAVIKRAALCVNNDGTGPCFWTVSNGSSLSDNLYVQNFTDRLELENINYLKIVFSLDNSTTNPQDFSAGIIKIGAQIKSILTH